MDQGSIYTNDEIIDIYNRHVDTIYRVCLMYLKNVPDTEDAVQDIFIKLIKKKREFKNPEHEKAWLIVASQNHCKNKLKNWWKKKRSSMDNVSEPSYIEKLPQDNIWDKLILLPNKYKIVIYLYYYEGYSTEEISEILSIKSSTIRTRLCTARKKLKIILEEENQMKKKDLFNSFKSIKPNDRQKSKMLNEILNHKEDHRKFKKRKPKLVMALSLVLIMTTTVIATNIDSFVNLLDKINPEIVEFIHPVEEVSIDKDIKMEVIAVGRYDNMVKLYISVEDLVSDRIGEDLSFLDYYSIKGANSYSWSMLDYDKENKKAILFIEAENDTKFEGEHLSFNVDNIFYDHKEYEEHEIGFDLSTLADEENYINANPKQFLSWSFGGLYGDLDDKETVPILKPNIKNISIPDIKSSIISNIGIIDDKLHIQLWKDKIEGQFVDIYLKDSNGERIYSDTHINFDIDKSGQPTNNTDYPYYGKYIFDIDTDNLDQYTLLGDFTTSSQLEGDWQIRFRAEDSGELLDIPCEINFENIQIENIKVNPFGITIVGKDNQIEDNFDLDINIHTEDNMIKVSPLSATWNNKDFISIYETDKPIDLNLIESIVINGIEVFIEE